VKEETGEYYCYRQPQQHSGKSLPWLLLGLGVPSSQIDGLIAEFSTRERSQLLTVTPSPVSFDWNKFEPAYRSDAVLNYLRERGYDDPFNLCRDFDLRFTPHGRFSWRVMFPLTAGGDIVGAVGRTIRGADPRYLTLDPFGGCVYLPRRATRTRLLILLEGPFDALTIAREYAPEDVTAVAILGLSLPAERKMTIGALAASAGHVVYVQDADQPVSATYRLINELQSIPSVSRVERASPPRGRKDPGEMAAQREELRLWLKDIFQSGVAHSKTGVAPTPPAMRGEYAT
jgi:hypothetical protein